MTPDSLLTDETAAVRYGWVTVIGVIIALQDGCCDNLKIAGYVRSLLAELVYCTLITLGRPAAAFLDRKLVLTGGTETLYFVWTKACRNVLIGTARTVGHRHYRRASLFSE